MSLTDMTVPQLREIAADLDIAGRSKMKKAELVAAIEYAEAPSADNIPGGIDDHAAAVAKMRANREAEEEERAAARRARNRTNYAPATEAAQADAAAGELLDAVLGKHSYHNPQTNGRPAAFDVTASLAGLGDAMKKATDALSGLIKATTGSVAITKYSANDAIATAAFGSASLGGYVSRERGRWVLRDGEHTIRAKTLGKVGKLWAK
jgi:hypothetical protein